ncbi:MAG: hypothetical protein D3906_15060 [Candidatus Electrothrix sp. AUS1_2]|nr:hypothetical protein [Candidatus Electrothrix sp. AUS1_2]
MGTENGKGFRTPARKPEKNRFKKADRISPPRVERKSPAQLVQKRRRMESLGILEISATLFPSKPIQRARSWLYSWSNII